VLPDLPGVLRRIAARFGVDQVAQVRLADCFCRGWLGGHGGVMSCAAYKFITAKNKKDGKTAFNFTILSTDLINLRAIFWQKRL
jgi:hypothetical protein